MHDAILDARGDQSPLIRDTGCTAARYARDETESRGLRSISGRRMIATRTLRAAIDTYR